MAIVHGKKIKIFSLNSNPILAKEIADLLEERKIARQNKDYSKSDEIRDKIYSLGYEVKDTREGQMLKKL